MNKIVMRAYRMVAGEQVHKINNTDCVSDLRVRQILSAQSLANMIRIKDATTM